MKSLTSILILDKNLGKASKGIGGIKKLHKSLPRDALLTIYKSVIRCHLEYCDVV